MLIGIGKCSEFGGPDDTGVGAQEGLGCIELVDLSDWWFDRIFLPASEWNQEQGLARNLNPKAYYIAMRWAYGTVGGRQGNILPGYTREQVRRMVFRISANNNSLIAQAADWGPGWDGPEGDRILDGSPGLLADLGVPTDGTVTVEALT